MSPVLRLLFALSLAPATLALVARPTAAQAYKLNAPFELEAITGDVQDFRVKSNGNFVFFRADERHTGVIELFTVPALGGAQPFRENRWLVADRAVVAYEPSPAGNWVVFVADQDREDTFELYSRRPGDTRPRKLSGMPASGDVDALVVTPDGTHVVYAAIAETTFLRELYSVAIDGSSPPVKLSDGQGDDYGVFGPFLVSSTGERVVYISDQAEAGPFEFELYSAPLDGSAPSVMLDGSLGSLLSFTGPPPMVITSDGQTVVYLDNGDKGVRELHRVPIDGSAPPMQIHPALPAGGEVFSFLLSPDDQRVVYSADQIADNVYDVWTVPLDGSAAPIALAGQLASPVAISPDSSRVVLDAPMGSARELWSVAIDGSSAPEELDAIPGGEFMEVAVSPDSQRVVYQTGSGCLGSCTNVASLRSVPIDGSASAVRLDPQAAGFFVLDSERGVPFVISFDSTRVVYHWGDADEDNTLYSVPIGGGALVALAAGRVSREYALSPTGPRAFFMADLTGGELFELYSVGSVSGAGLVKLSGALARDTAADVFTPTNFLSQAFRIDSSGERAVYSADPSVDQDFELFSVRTDGQGPAIALNQDREIRSFDISPDGEHAVFLFEEDAAHASFGELFSVPMDGSASPIQLNHVLAPQHVVFDFQFSWDGARVVYRASGNPSDTGLWSAPIAGGGPPLNIVNNVVDYAVSPSGNRVVYTRHENLPGWSLGSAPLDGSAAPVILDADGPHEFRISADGTRVVYRFEVDGRVYGVPADGSASPVLLSGTITPIEAPVLSPDGAWAVFAGDETPGLTELFAVPSDGSAAPVKISGTLVTSGDVFTNFSDCSALVSISNRVVYVADQETDDVYELYSAPIDGSASPIKLNGALAPGGDVFADQTVSTRHVRISTDGARVVYVADADTDEVFELYSVPIDGSATPVKLNGPLVVGGDVSVDLVPGIFNGRVGRAFQISSDSTRVVYAADQEADGLRELFLAALDGSVPPRKLNWPLARAGVAAFEIAPDSARVLYQATERSLVTELFASGLSFEPLAPHAAPRQKP